MLVSINARSAEVNVLAGVFITGILYGPWQITSNQLIQLLDVAIKRLALIVLPDTAKGHDGAGQILHGTFNEGG
jgi:hypothetical protein